MEHAKARASVDRQYEDFEPSTEWVPEEDSQTFIVYLPGFRKEQLKVQVTSTRNLRISGERPLGGNKWSRFREESSIPSDCDINSISARFDGGMLYVKLPKKITPESPTQEIEELKPPTHHQEPAKNPHHENKDQKHETDHPQPVASATRKDDNQTDEKINGNATASGVSQKTREKVEKKTASEKSDGGLGEAGKLASTSSGSSISKAKLGKYKKSASELVMELKKPKKVINLVVAVLLAIVLLLYVTNGIRSLGKPKNTIQ